MVYTSGVFHGTHQTLEQAQFNKMSMICNKLQIKKGHRTLDIGCGWVSLVRHMSREFGAKATGVTLSKEGAKWCREYNDKEFGKAGFNVHSLENVGVHYAHTIHRWYQNWNKEDHRKHILEKYDERLFRLWNIF